MEKIIKEIIKNWENIKYDDYFSIEYFKFLLSDLKKNWNDFTSGSKGDNPKMAEFSKTQLIRFLLARDEIQENKIKDLESKIKDLEKRISLNYKMLTEENEIEDKVKELEDRIKKIESKEK